jgi:hypothetical protein
MPAIVPLNIGVPPNKVDIPIMENAPPQTAIKRAAINKRCSNFIPYKYNK